MASKLVAFFSTSTGKNVSGAIALTAVISGALVKYIPNSYGMEEMKNFLQLYRNSFPVTVPAEVNEQLEQVKRDMKFSDKDAKLISAFTVYGFNIIHLGTTWFRTGVLVGLPANFSYKQPSDVDKKIITVGNKAVHWSSPDGLALESSLILSDSAKKFAIARELAIASGSEVAFNTALNGSSIFMYYYLTYSFNRKLKLFDRPIAMRTICYILFGTMMLTMWFFIKDFTTYKREELADETAAGISEEYARGAVEYYNKTLQRNIALRSLLGNDGPLLYTSAGNEREIMRTKHVPFVTRRDRAAQRLKALYQISHVTDNDENQKKVDV